MTLPLADAVAAYTTGVDALLAADVDTPSHHDLVDLLTGIDTATRRVAMTQYAIVARLDREADPKTLGATSLTTLLMLRTRISKGAAHKWIKRARHLIGRRTLQGEVLPALWEHTAAALAAGAISGEHVEVIRKFLKALPATVDPLTRSQAEQSLAEVAADLDPRGLTITAMHLLALLHPDGEAPAEEAARKVGLTLGPQQPDGTSYLRGWISAKMRALLEPIQEKLTERGRHPTPDRGPEPVADPEPENRPEPEPEAEAEPAAEEPGLFDHQEPEPEPEPAEDFEAEVPAEDDPFAPHPDDPSPSAPDPEPEPEGENVAVDDNPFAPHPDDEPSENAPNPLLNSQWRTKAQYTHDAFETALELLLRSSTLGRLNGLPTTVANVWVLRCESRRSPIAVWGVVAAGLSSDIRQCVQGFSALIGRYTGTGVGLCRFI